MTFRNPLTSLPASAITGQLSGSQIAPGAITTTSIAPGSITTPLIATGAVDTTKLTVTGAVSNLLPDGGFEGVPGAALVAAAGPHWGLDTAHFNAPGVQSVKANASGAQTTTNCNLLTNIPAAPGDQLYLQTDWSATALAGSGSVAQKMFVQWQNAAGGVISFGVLTAPATLDGAWRTLSGTFTAPAGTVSYSVALQIFQYTNVVAWYDNCIVRPVVGSTQIQAGSIQTGHLSATAINGMTVTGATLQTAASGNRMVIANDAGGADLKVYSGLSGESPGSLQVGDDTNGPYVNLFPPIPSLFGAPLAELTLRNNPTAGTSSAQITANGIFLNGTVYDYLTGLELVGIVQDWTTVTLASTYSASGGGNGVPQYRVINIGGTNVVEWRGGVGLGYTGTTLNNSGNFLASALPYTPPNGRSVMCAAQWLSQWSVRVDFNTSGGTAIQGTGSSYAPNFLSLNGVRYTI